MPNSLSIGLKGSEEYSPIILEFFGLVAQEVSMGTNAKEVFDFTGQLYIQQRGASLILPENQAALVKKNKLACAEFGRTFIAFLNNEYPVPELNIEDKKIIDDDEKLDLAFKTIPRVVQLILRKHLELAQDIDLDLDLDLDSEWMGKDTSNQISTLSKAVENLHRLDEMSVHETFKIELIHLLSQGLTPETDPNINERRCALAVIQQLFASSFKVNRVGVLQFVDSIKNCNPDEIIDTVEDYISLFYELPLQDLILKIENDIVEKIRQDATLHKYLEKSDKENPQAKLSEDKQSFKINSFGEFIRIFYDELNTFIKDWFTILVDNLVDNNANKPIDKDQYEQHEASLVQYGTEVLSWLEYLTTFFNELEPRAEEIGKLINSIKAIDADAENPILDRLNYLNKLIEIKFSYFRKFARIYIDNAALGDFESSEDRNFKEFKHELLLAKNVINHFEMIKNDILEWNKKQNALSQDIEQLNHSQVPPSARLMVLKTLLQPVVSLKNSILEKFQKLKDMLSRTSQLLDLNYKKINYSAEINDLQQANSEARQLYWLNFKLDAGKVTAKKFFTYFYALIKKCEATFKIPVENFEKYVSEITQPPSFSNNLHLQSSPIHSRSDNNDSRPAKKPKLNEGNKGKEEEKSDEEDNRKTPPFMV